MKYLLDTVVFLWVIFDERSRISATAISILEDPKNELFFSAASAWEIAIKYSLGKLELKKNPAEWLPDLISKMGLHPLPISQRHALEVGRLPYHHRDPFDRLLVAQAKTEGLPMITPDSLFKDYEMEVVWD